MGKWTVLVMVGLGLVTVLKSAGYKTFLSGKWHMGEAAGDGPNHHKFDHSYGSIAGAVGMYEPTCRKGEGSETCHRDNTIVRYSCDEPKQVSDWQLFNLKDDPKEENNIAATHPDVRSQLHERFLKQGAMDLK